VTVEKMIVANDYDDFKVEVANEFGRVHTAIESGKTSIESLKISIEKSKLWILMTTGVILLTTLSTLGRVLKWF
jgi:hypothetical protein